jgi:hypothetical protein
VEQWFVGCNVSHVVTEGTSIQRYLGYSSNLITVSASILKLNVCLIIETNLFKAQFFISQWSLSDI